MTDPPLIGVGYRAPLADWILSLPPLLECVEVTAEHFFDGGADRLRKLSEGFVLSVHGLGLSLGTPGPLDPQKLAGFSRVVRTANPRWISEHVAFTRTEDVDLGHLNPVPPTRSSLETLAEHARRLSDACAKPLVLENITSFLRLAGEMSEPEFLNQLCASAECGLLLDVTNLLINSRNHDFDPLCWLHALNPVHIEQVHLVGYSQGDGKLEDRHSEPVQDDVLALLGEVLRYADVKVVFLERDGRFPASGELNSELRRIHDVIVSTTGI